MKMLLLGLALAVFYGWALACAMSGELIGF